MTRPAQAVELHWDSEDETWNAHASAGGAAGTCLFQTIGLRVEFDRIDGGKITRLSVSPDLDPAVSKLVESLLASGPPGAPDERPVWEASVDPSVALALWDFADLADNVSTAAEGGGATSDVFVLEFAAAAARLRGLGLDEVVGEPSNDEVERAARSLLPFLGTQLPVTLIACLVGRLQQLTAGDGAADSGAVHSLLQAGAAALEPESCAVAGDVNAQVELRADSLVVDFGAEFNPTSVAIARAWRDEELVGIATCEQQSTTVGFVSFFGASVQPTRVTIESPSRALSLRRASSKAREALYSEAVAELATAREWELAAAWWFDARSRNRAAKALTRAAVLAQDAITRARLIQLSDQVDPSLGAESQVLPLRAWSSWASFFSHCVPLDAVAASSLDPAVLAPLASVVVIDRVHHHHPGATRRRRRTAATA